MQNTLFSLNVQLETQYLSRGRFSEESCVTKGEIVSNRLLLPNYVKIMP